MSDKYNCCVCSLRYFDNNKVLCSYDEIPTIVENPVEECTKLTDEEKEEHAL